MLAPIRQCVRDDPEPGEWFLNELAYMERNAELFDAVLTR
jgi:hypothetical protein